MPAISIETEGGKTAYELNDMVKLKSKADPGASDFQWQLDGKDIPEAANQNQWEFSMTDKTVGAYTVSAKFPGQTDPVTSSQFSITLAEADEAPAVYHPGFARDVAIALGIIGAVVFVVIAALALSLFQGTTWTDLEGRLKVAIVLGLPATVVGSALLVVGLWMLAVEWRGRMVEPPPSTTGGASKGLDVAGVGQVITAISGLKGSALALVIGALLMLGSAWVAQSAAGAPDSNPTATPTPAPAQPAAPGAGGEAPAQ